MPASSSTVTASGGLSRPYSASLTSLAANVRSALRPVNENRRLETAPWLAWSASGALSDQSSLSLTSSKRPWGLVTTTFLTLAWSRPAKSLPLRSLSWSVVGWWRSTNPMYAPRPTTTSASRINLPVLMPASYRRRRHHTATPSKIAHPGNPINEISRT